MSFATITPSRGDRPEFLDFCKYQLSRMTLKPDKSYFIDHPPVNDKKDLVARIRKGVEAAKREGFDKVYIVEDDDFYDKNYFERQEFDTDFIGRNRSLYYNINNRTYEYLHHPNHSSLYCTGFKISALNGFTWPDPLATFLDLKLWRYAQRNNKRITLHHDSIGVSIKHGIGVSGGSGHRRTFKRSDQDLEFLKSQVDAEAFDFYQSIMK